MRLKFNSEDISGELIRAKCFEKLFRIVWAQNDKLFLIRCED